MIRLFLSSFAVVLIGTFCAFASHLILAKILPAEQYGIFSFITSVSLLLGVFSLFGFQNSLSRLIPSLQSKGEAGESPKNLLQFSRRFTVSLACMSGISIYAILYGTGFTTKYPTESFLIGVALVPLMVLVRLHASMLRGFQKSTLSVLYETSLREILFLLIITGSIFLGFQLEAGLQALSFFVVSLLIVAIISAVHLNKLTQKEKLSGSVSKETTWEWVRLSFPMMLIIFAQRLMRRSDVIILGLMVHPALVGAYALIAQFSDVSAIGQKGIFAVFSSRAAALYQAGSSLELKVLYRKMQILGILSTALMAVGIALFAFEALAFFGDDYMVAYQALFILLAGQFINVCFGPVGVLMIMTAHEKVAMKITMVAALGNLILNPLAIYFYGLEGAATVTAFLLVLRALASYIIVKKEQLL